MKGDEDEAHAWIECLEESDKNQIRIILRANDAEGLKRLIQEIDEDVDETSKDLAMQD